MSTESDLKSNPITIAKIIVENSTLGQQEKAALQIFLCEDLVLANTIVCKRKAPSDSFMWEAFQARKKAAVLEAPVSAPTATAAPASGHTAHPPAVGEKMKNILTLQELTAPPSAFGIGVDSISAKGGTSWVQVGPKYDIRMHRPTPDLYGIPCTLLSECFALFKDEFGGTAELLREDCQVAESVCVSMCQVLSHSARQQSLNDILSNYFNMGARVGVMPMGTGGIAADGGLWAQCGQLAANTSATILLEYQADMALGSSTPVERNVGYYVQCLRHVAHFAKMRSACPTLLVNVTGPYMSVSFAAHSRHVVVDPATPFLPLLALPHDPETMASVARMLKCIKNCVGRLAAHYNSLPDAELTPDEFEQLKFPYVRSFTDRNGVLCSFAYVRQAGEKLVFEAAVTSAPAEAVLRVGACLVVKFTRSYCAEAHQLCAALDPPVV